MQKHINQMRGSFSVLDRRVLVGNIGSSASKPSWVTESARLPRSSELGGGCIITYVVR